MALALTSLLLLLAHSLPAAAADSGRQLPQGSPLSTYGTQICTGMVEAFLHKGNLTQSEVDCMVSTMGNIAFGAYESAENIVALFGQLSGLGGPGARQQEVPVGPLVVLRLAKGMHGLVHTLDSVMDSCVEGRSLQLLTKAGDHLRNLTYIAGRVAANGADIVEELSDAMDAFNAHQYKRFGEDVGTVCRKVLLSNASSELLPEGPPSPEQLVNVSAGLLQGFFGEGFELIIGSDARIVTQPKVRIMDFIQDGFSTKEEERKAVVSEDKTRLNVHIDLHRCVSQNLDLFRAVMSKAWLYFAEAALQPPEHEMRRFLSVMLQGLPGVLARCGVEPQQQLMLADAVHSLRHVQLRLQMPERPASAGEAAEHLRTAAGHWSRLSWFAFGTDLGRMLQGLAVKAYPERYAITSMGSLRQAGQKAVAIAQDAQEKLDESVDRPSASELSAGGFKSSDELGAGSGLSVSGVQIVTGIAEGLLHREELSQSEATCLIASVGNVIGGAEQTADGLVTVFEDLSANAMADGPQPDVTELMGELTRSIDGVARLAEGFMANCRSSAAEAFQLALQHLGSLRYVTGRLAANGADVTDGIDRAVASMKGKDGHPDPHTFGREVGRVLRKVLLSSNTKPVLPEGNSTLPEIVNVSAGVLQGFFGRGFELDISSDQKIVTMPIFPMAAMFGGEGMEEQKPKGKRLNIHIDLHACVERNLPFFQSLMAGVMQTFAVQEVATSPTMFGSPWMMAGLAEMPKALQRCGLDLEQEEMLMQAMEALAGLHMKLQAPVPDESIAMDRDHAVELLKRCVSDWSKLKWFALGEDLGRILREALLLVLPGTYSTDDEGNTIKSFVGLSDAAPVETRRAAPSALAPAGILLMAGALALVAGMAVVRAVAVAQRLKGPSEGAEAAAAGLDLGSDAEDFETGLVRAGGALE